MYIGKFLKCMVHPTTEIQFHLLFCIILFFEIVYNKKPKIFFSSSLSLNFFF